MILIMISFYLKKGMIFFFLMGHIISYSTQESMLMYSRLLLTELHMLNIF